MMAIFSFLNFLYLFRRKYKLEFHKKVCENKDSCCITMPSKDTKLVEFNQYQKGDKTRYIIYADHKSLIKRIDGCTNNFEKYLQKRKQYEKTLKNIKPFKFQ